MAPGFNWDDQPDASPAAPKKSGKFSWDDQPDAEPAQAPEPTMGESLLAGIVKVGETVDSYTGAPVRAGIGAAQDGAGVGGALSAAWQQVGEDPKRAPTGRDIRTKAGVDLGDNTILANDGMVARLMTANPTAYAMKEVLTRVSPNQVADLAVESAADVTNLLPVAGAAKRIASGSAKAASRAVNAGADAVAGAGKIAAKGGTRAMQGVLGVPEESITRYLARHSQLKGKVGAREMAEELAGRLDDGLKPARAQFAAAEDAVARAKLARTEDLAELQIKRADAAESLRRAEDSALGEAASRVATRVNQLDEKVSAGSSAAFDILDKEGVTVPTRQLKARMTAGIKALEERAVTDEQTEVVALLNRYRERLDKFGAEIPGGEAKRILQSLDREMKHLAPGEIGRMSKPDQALGALRRHIDEPLKNSPAYAAQMQDVSRLMKVLENTRGLATDGAAARALKAAKGATGKDRAEAIQTLAAEFGDDFLKSVDRRNLPEYHQMKALLHRVRAAKKGAGVSQAEAALEAARGQVGDAVDLGSRGVAGITDKINATVRATNPGAVQTQNLRKAGDLAGVNMADELADIRTIASFEKGYNRGSANTNFWGAVAGGVSGMAFGPGGALGGAAAGGALGRIVVDNFGPKVGRLILDQVPRLQKMKPAEWVRSLDVPPAVKAKLATDLDAYRALSQGTKGSVAGAKILGGPDRWAARGLEKLGVTDPEQRERLLASKEGKRLAIEASDLSPESPAMKRIKERLERMNNATRTPNPSEAPGYERKPARGR